MHFYFFIDKYKVKYNEIKRKVIKEASEYLAPFGFNVQYGSNSDIDETGDWIGQYQHDSIFTGNIIIYINDELLKQLSDETYIMSDLRNTVFHEIGHAFIEYLSEFDDEEIKYYIDKYFDIFYDDNGVSDEDLCEDFGFSFDASTYTHSLLRDAIEEMLENGDVFTQHITENLNTMNSKDKIYNQIIEEVSRIIKEDVYETLSSDQENLVGGFDVRDYFYADSQDTIANTIPTIRKINDYYCFNNNKFTDIYDNSAAFDFCNKTIGETVIEFLMISIIANKENKIQVETPKSWKELCQQFLSIKPVAEFCGYYQEQEPELLEEPKTLDEFEEQYASQNILEFIDRLYGELGIDESRL